MAAHPAPTDVLIVGATGGIGAALVADIRQRYPSARVTAWSRHRPASLPEAVAWSAVDILDEASIASAVGNLAGLDLVIVATGVLHRAAQPERTAIAPEKTWRSIDPAAMTEVFALNSIAPATIAKHVLPKFPRDRRAVLAVLSARVGSISDNRLGGWYSYRASKAALNQIIRTLSIELATRHPHAICVGLHPGTVDSALSKPFQSNVATDKLFTAAYSAGRLLDVLDTLMPQNSGGVYDWAGVRVAE
jgi:NAD(P)-dependent dehydrogenase (short-subunit alcohol dehydrogenase family)